MSLVLTIQRPLLQVQVRLRIILQHIFSHAQILGNVCADSAYGFNSNRKHGHWLGSVFTRLFLSLLCAE